MNDYMRRAGSVNRAGSLFKNKPTRFQLTSCNGEAISTKLTTDCRVGFKMIQNCLPSYKRASSLHVITPLMLCCSRHQIFKSMFCNLSTLCMKGLNVFQREQDLYEYSCVPNCRGVGSNRMHQGGGLSRFLKMGGVFRSFSYNN